MGFCPHSKYCISYKMHLFHQALNITCWGWKPQEHVCATLKIEVCPRSIMGHLSICNELKCMIYLRTQSVHFGVLVDCWGKGYLHVEVVPLDLSGRWPVPCTGGPSARTGKCPQARQPLLRPNGSMLLCSRHLKTRGRMAKLPHIVIDICYINIFHRYTLLFETHIWHSINEIISYYHHIPKSFVLNWLPYNNVIVVCRWQLTIPNHTYETNNR